MGIEDILERIGSRKEEVILNKDFFYCGRMKDNDLICLSLLVSKQHCVFTKTPSGLCITDLGCSNGIFVNGKPLIRKTQLLKENDLIGIGCAELSNLDESMFVYKVTNRLLFNEVSSKNDVHRLQSRFTMDVEIVLDRMGQKQEDFIITKDFFTCGRMSENELACPSLLVSRQHCVFFKLPHGLYVIDLGSANGIFVNENFIPPKKEILLKENDLIGIGCAVESNLDESTFVYKVKNKVVNSNNCNSNKIISTKQKNHQKKEEIAACSISSIIMKQETVKSVILPEINKKNDNIMQLNLIPPVDNLKIKSRQIDTVDRLYSGPQSKKQPLPSHEKLTKPTTKMRIVKSENEIRNSILPLKSSLRLPTVRSKIKKKVSFKKNIALIQEFPIEPGNQMRSITLID